MGGFNSKYRGEEVEHKLDQSLLKEKQDLTIEEQEQVRENLDAAQKATTLQGYGIADAYTKEEVAKVITESISSTYVAKGNWNNSTLAKNKSEYPFLSDARVGWVYNSNVEVTFNDKKYPIGTNFVILNVAENGDITWDDLGGFVDLSSKQDKLIAGDNIDIKDGKEIRASGYTYNKGTKALSENTDNEASGINSHAEGYGTTASGAYSHSEGNGTNAKGISSHTEGYKSAANKYAHAEGNSTNASGESSHVEGVGSQSQGVASHAEGNRTTASGTNSHAEGDSTKSIGNNSHTEGFSTQSIGNASHAEGNGTNANGENTHAEGNSTYAIGINSHSEGYGKKEQVSVTIPKLNNSDTFQITKTISNLPGSNTDPDYNSPLKVGKVYKLSKSNLYISVKYYTYETIERERISFNKTYRYTYKINDFLTTYSDDIATEEITGSAFGSNSHSEGYLTSAIGDSAHSEGKETLAIGYHSHSEGYLTTTKKAFSHAEGHGSDANGEASHSEGFATNANGDMSHAEGSLTEANGDYSHSEGNNTIANGESSHAEGEKTHANGGHSHAEGYGTTASGNWGSHAEGNTTTASGANAHAEGTLSKAKGHNSHAEGYETETQNTGEHAEGIHNISIKNVTLHTVGMGKDYGGSRLNAHTITVDGKHYVPNIGGYKGTETSLDSVDDLATVVNSKLDTLTQEKHGGRNVYIDAQGKINAGGYDIDQGIYSFSTNLSIASGEYSHSEGYKTTSDGYGSHSEGTSTLANNGGCHAEGNLTISIGGATHSEGFSTLSSGVWGSHAEGCETTSLGRSSHAEGKGYTNSFFDDISNVNGSTFNTTKIKFYKIGSYCYFYNEHYSERVLYQVIDVDVPNNKVTLNSNCYFSSGQYRVRVANIGIASGDYSHSEGEATIASGLASHAEGKFNVDDKSFIHTVGIGDYKVSKNAHTITTEGKHYIPDLGGYKGTETDLSGVKDVATVINSKPSSRVVTELTPTAEDPYATKAYVENLILTTINKPI